MRFTRGLRVVVGKRATDVFLRFLAAFTVLVSALGFWGLSLEHTDASLPDNLYRLIVLYTTDMDFSTAENWQLGAARILAPVITVSALVWVLVEGVSQAFVLMKLRLLPPHYIIAGSTPLGMALVSALRDLGSKSVVMIDAAPDETASSFCESNRTILVRGDIGRESSLKAIGALGCKAVFFVGADEVENILGAEELQKLDMSGHAGDVSERSTFVQINSGSLFHGLYSYQRFTDRAIPFALEALIARDTVLRFPVWEYSDARALRRVHALIIGFGQQGQALARELVLHCHYKDLLQTAISVVSLEGETALSAFLIDYPKFGKACRFTALQAPSGRWEEAVEELQKLEEDDPFSAIYVATGDESENLSVALSLRQVIECKDCLLAPVFVQFSEGRQFSKLLNLASVTNRFDRVMEPFGILDDVLKHSALLDNNAEDFAKFLHARYEKDFLIETWPLLSETMRESNRRAACHSRIKLSSAGYAVRAGSSEVISLDPDADIVKHKDELWDLARIEHDRWCSDRFVDGWDYAPVTDKPRKLHKCLVPFDQLDLEDQKKDLMQIPALIDWSKGAATPVEINTRKLLSIAIYCPFPLSSDQLARARQELSALAPTGLFKLNEAFEVHVIESFTLGSGDWLSTSVMEAAQSVGSNVTFTAILPFPAADLAAIYATKLSADDSPDAGSAPSYSRDHFYSKLTVPDWVVDLKHPRDRSNDVFDSVFQQHQSSKVRAYLAERADMLVVLAGNADPEFSESIEEIVRFRRNPEGIPEEVSSLPRKSANRRTLHDELIVVDI